MTNEDMTIEQYREKLEKLFQFMDQRKLKYYYNYIMEYEKE